MLDQVTNIEFPFFQRDVEEMFGRPNEGSWAEQYMKTVDLSMFGEALAHIRDYEGNPWGQKIYCNYVMEGPLLKGFGFLASRGLAGELHTYDGCFNIRMAKSGRIMSMHSWGLALDFDAARNPFRPDGDLMTSFSVGFVRCFADGGFEWGGSWDAPKDAMHFQLPWIRTRTGIYAPVPYTRDPIPEGIAD